VDEALTSVYKLECHNYRFEGAGTQNNIARRGPLREFARWPAICTGQPTCKEDKMKNRIYEIDNRRKLKYGNI